MSESGEATWPAQIHDCKAAIRWLRANADKYQIDPQRIGVWGSSAGGHLVNLLGTSGDVEELEGDGGSPGQSSRVHCVVPFCGPTNFLAPKRLEGGRSPSAVDLLLGGKLDERQDLAKQASPITYVSADDPPFLIVHGTADNTVPFEQAEMFYGALKNAGVDVTLIKLLGGGHAVGGEEVLRSNLGLRHNRHGARELFSMIQLRCVILALAIFPAAMTLSADVVVPLTAGPGDDTEAVWSPDGTQIAFQTTRAGRAEIHVLDLETGQTRCLVGGVGQSQYPAWSPDGTRLAFVHANVTKTAVQGIEQGHNLCVIPSRGGQLRRLTEGVVREYTPCWSPDGAFIYFSSTRDLGDFAVGIWRIPTSGGEPELVLGEHARDVGFIQPALSPGGDVLACGVIRSFRGNWAIRLSKLEAPRRFLMLTDGLWPAYGPRWSPDGLLIACTGYRPGDPGWGLYVLEMKQGGFARLDTGPGNSRSPAWSPDGTQLVFENNRTGAYKLYRMNLPRMDFADPPDNLQDALVPLVRFSFEQRPEEQVMDLTGSGNMGTVSGDLPWVDGAVAMGSGYVNIDEPKGFDFGPGAFSVAATVEIAAHSHELRLLAVGDYPEHRHGWQLMLGLDDRLYFNSRTAAGDWSAASTAGPAPVGKKVQIVGVRRRGGGVELYVDGKRQTGTGASATFNYRQPTRVRVGALYDGSAPFQGRLYEFSVYRGVLDVGDELVVSLEEFLRR